VTADGGFSTFPHDLGREGKGREDVIYNVGRYFAPSM